MSLRRTIFWIHLAVGVTGAVAILLMAATGVLLTYEAQLDRWALRGYRADPAPGAAPLALDELIARVGGEAPAGLVASVALHRDPREPAVFGLGDGATVHVDRFTGESPGDGDTRTRRFLRGVMYFHRWLALEGEYRIVGRTIMATANLGFLFLLVSGVYLWWPSRGGRAAWRQALWFRRGLGGRARDFNWHNVIGFWSAVPLAVVVFSGATISYQWAADLVHLAAGDARPFQQSPRSSASVARVAGDARPFQQSPRSSASVARVAGDARPFQQLPQSSASVARVAGDARPFQQSPQSSASVARVAGDARPFQQSPQSSASVARDASSVTPDPSAAPVELHALAAKAVAETPGWQAITISLPESTRDPVVVAVDRGTGRQPSMSEDLLFDRATGELVGRGGYPTFSRGFKVRRWLRFAHTGEVYGVIGQSIAGAVSLGAAIMVWTGLAMTWRRFFGAAGRG